MTLDAPLLTWKGGLLALMLACIASWPMLVGGSYFFFHDTGLYIGTGEKIFNFAIGTVSQVFQTPGGGTDTSTSDVIRDNRIMVLRSFVYSLYVFIMGGGVWPPIFATLQAAAVIWSAFALIDRTALDHSWVLAVGMIPVMGLTTLPWFTVYLMPDILVAMIVIYAAVLLTRYDHLSRIQLLVLCGLTTFAVASHYGHGPIAFGLLAGVIAWRAIRRQLTWGFFVAAVIPVLFSPVANLTTSAVVLDDAEVTPMRLPILLARSLQDGPAFWYLSAACPEADHAFCEAFPEESPRWIGDFLWSENGVRSLSPEIMNRIRDEECEVLWAAFRAYPAQQTWSLAGNTVLQFFKVGTGQIMPAQLASSGRLEGHDAPRATKLLSVFDVVVAVGTAAGALVLAWLWASRRLTREQRDVLLVVLAGLALNALVFGGLSAPVDRYQSRLIWLLPVLAVIFYARSLDGQSRRDTFEASVTGKPNRGTVQS